MCLHRQSSLGVPAWASSVTSLVTSKVANQSTVGGASHVASRNLNIPAQTPSVGLGMGHLPPQ
jgi:hypothetical protein